KVVLANNPNTFSSNNQFLAWVAANASIAGTVYNDVNGNGGFDSGVDTGISGVTVSLSGTSSGTTTTVNGAYSFTSLTAGTYNVDYTEPTGYANTGAIKPISSIVLAYGATSSEYNYFARRTTST